MSYNVINLQKMNKIDWLGQSYLFIKDSSGREL